MTDSFDVTTIAFALLAIFVLFKLRTVLGARTGTERPPQNPFNPPNRVDEKPSIEATEANIARLPGAAEPNVDKERRSETIKRGEANSQSKALPGLDDIASTDTGFSVASFLTGAKGAYEMIVTAFAGGDKATLRTLLANEVYDGFESAIVAREGRGEKIETKFVSIEKAMIEDAHLRGTTAQITVRFGSKLITETRDKEDKVIDGNIGKVIDIVDVWTFSRDANSRDPNWKLVATEAAQ